MAAGLEPGDRIGPYTVVGLLGAGSPGWVYLARTGAGRPMAVRMLYGEQRGIKRAQKVRGPGVVEVISAGGATRNPWVASVYVPAPSLADLVISCGPLPPDAVRWLAGGIAEGLVTIHQASLVHGDLRPAQIVVASDGPRVTGFGIEGAGNPLAAPGYLAPEQARGEEPGPASDVYALGALLCFAATGRPPHSGTGEAETRRSVAAGEPELTDVPDELIELIRSCLTREPEDRPTPRALLDEVAADSADRRGAYGAAAWLPAPAMELIDAYHRRGRLVGDPPTVPLADRFGDPAGGGSAKGGSAHGGSLGDKVGPVKPTGPAAAIEPAADATRRPDPAGPARAEAHPAEPAKPGPNRTDAAGSAAAEPSAAAETMQLARIVEAMVPRIDDSDDRPDRYDLPVPREPHEAGGAGWLLVAALVVIALVGGLFGGVAYERGRGDRDRGKAGAADDTRASGSPADPTAAFVASTQVGGCVDFASDGTPGWRPAALRTLPCEDPAARQRVLARTSAGGGTTDCMNTDGRSRWPATPGVAALCLERIFRPGECVPAETRDGRQWAFLASLVPCEGPLPQDRPARLRIDEVHPLAAANATSCPGRSPVYYPLPSRNQELCMAPLP
ncbi:serine/threonine protein kinase [Embleya sp. NPDC008237]|uniref:serine/threonine protein kinase n=1 Tax=Embleya sp. NPDC008237 TaxID=3363978 RepID=UPI0036E13088